MKLKREMAIDAVSTISCAYFLSIKYVLTSSKILHGASRLIMKLYSITFFKYFEGTIPS